jgi:hypothetical protein
MEGVHLVSVYVQGVKGSRMMISLVLMYVTSFNNTFYSLFL